MRKIDEIHEDTMEAHHVRIANMIRLPFHLCTGSLYGISDPECSNIQLWLRNQIVIPYDLQGDDLIKYRVAISRTLTPTNVRTDALLVNHRPSFTEGELSAIRSGKKCPIRATTIDGTGLRLLNDVIAAHQIVRRRPYISSGATPWPYILTETEVVAHICVTILIIAREDRVIDDTVVKELFASIDPRVRENQPHAYGDLTDFPPDAVASIAATVVKVRKHVFYELRTRAVSAMLDGDSIVALVLACAACEAAHGAFLRLELQSRVTEEKREFNKLLSDLLREKGFSALVQLSVHVFLRPEERPKSPDALRQCMRGFELRNGIMHGAVDKSGQYKIRTYTANEINEGYGGVMAIYSVLAQAVEARETTVIDGT